jgi:hypothetical protein
VTEVKSTVLVVTGPWAALLAAVALSLLLLLANAIIVSVQPAPADPVQERRRGIWALVVGADGRTSTSKLQVVLWTFAVFYAFAFLLVWGRSVGCNHTVHKPVCTASSTARGLFNRVASNPLQPEYYVLLGFPLTAAIATKALTTAKVASGALTKKDVGSGDISSKKVLSEVISNDDHQTDLIDFQYFAFNLLTLAFFAIEFLTKPSNGLPNLPATLIGLSGLSTATYTAKKALETDIPPAITSVIPRRIRLQAGAVASIIGAGFGTLNGQAAKSEDDQGDREAGHEEEDEEENRRVTLDGNPLEIKTWRQTRIDVVLTRKAVDGYSKISADSFTGEIVVLSSDEIPSDEFAVELYRPK